MSKTWVIFWHITQTRPHYYIIKSLIVAVMPNNNRCIFMYICTYVQLCLSIFNCVIFFNFALNDHVIFNDFTWPEKNSHAVLTVYIWVGGCMVFSSTFNNISDISWLSVLLVQETGKPHRGGRGCIIWQLDLQPPMESVPITTNVLSLNPAHGEVYSIQHYVINFVRELLQVGGFLMVLQFPPQIKLK